MPSRLLRRCAQREYLAARFSFMIAVPKIYAGKILDRRTLTNVQRASMGLSPRGHSGKRGPRGPNIEKLQKGDEVFDTLPAVRLEQQLRAMFAKWPEWVRFMNAHR